MINAIVTGASRGIGFQTVLALVQNKNISVIAIARSKSKLLKLKQLSPNNIEIIDFDLESQNFELLIKKISEIIQNKYKNHNINILINNAGFLINKKFLLQTEIDWEKQFNVNFFSSIKLIKYLFPYFDKSKKGTHIINISSMSGVQGSIKYNGLSLYSASKAALNSFTQCLAVEFSNNNIHVNSVNPGSVKTEMFKNAFPESIAEISAEQMGKYIADFALNSGKLFNGRIVEVSLVS